jgi:hypothetical protein
VGNPGPYKSSAVVPMTFAAREPQLIDQSHWLWSETPVSAFSHKSGDSGSGDASAPFRRKRIAETDFEEKAEKSFRPQSIASPIPSPLLAKLEVNTLSEILHLLHDAAEDDANSQPVEFNRVQLTYGTKKDENFFGFGEQFSHFNMKGKRVPIFVQEQGIGRGDQPVTALANFVSNR